MANKKNKKQKILRSKFLTFLKLPNLPRKTWVKLSPLLVIGGLIVLWFLFSAILTTVNYVKLETAGRKLDKLQAGIEKTGLSVEIYRDNYCWRTGDKYSKGTRYCHQRLIVIGKDKDVATQIIEATNLSSLISNVSSTSLPTNLFDYGSSNYVLNTEKLGGGCRVTYDAMDDSREGNKHRNVYSFDIICSRLIPLFNIYPFSNYSSWDNYSD